MTMNRTDWLRPVEEYVRIWSSFREECVPSGASAAELENLEIAASQARLHVPDQYLELLRFVNGTGFDGFNFAGAGTADGLSDFLRFNDRDDDAFDGDVTIYGISSGVLYVYSASARRYQILDGVDAIADFDTFGEMIEFAFSREVTSLRRTLRST